MGPNDANFAHSEKRNKREGGQGEKAKENSISDSPNRLTDFSFFPRTTALIYLVFIEPVKQIP